MTTPQRGAPLDSAAAEVLDTVRRLGRRPALTAAERAEAEQAARDDRYCVLCGGIHASPSTPACPRLATFKTDGDGRVTEGSFWPGTEWAEGRVILAEDAAETEDVPGE